jgi:hypothetical protein
MKPVGCSQDSRCLALTGEDQTLREVVTQLSRTILMDSFCEWIAAMAIVDAAMILRRANSILAQPARRA